MVKDIPFTEDQWWRCINNLNVRSHFLKEITWRHHTDKQRDDLLDAIDQFENYAYQLYNNFGDQFHHRADARRVCPNPDCHSVYAYFFADWKYCPKCGTKLLITKEHTEE